MRGLGPRIHRCEFRPRVGRGHIYYPHSFYSWLWWLDCEQCRSLTVLDTPPELTLGGDDQVLVERIGMNLDLDPFAAAGNHRQDGIAGCHHEHVVLQLGGVLLCRAL